MMHDLPIWSGRCISVLSVYVATLLDRSMVASFFTSFLVAAGFLASRRIARRRLSWRVWRRAMFPARWLIGPSAKADIGIYLFNTATFGVLFGWLILSGEAVAAATHHVLTQLLGSLAPCVLPVAASTAILGTIIFLAYELGYWLDHYLKHRFDVLWPFHKVHHTAQTLSPLTNYRMHPVDSIIFGNILSLTMGAAYGAACFAVGRGTDPLLLAKGTLAGLILSLTIGPLQHSHVWMPIRGFLGRIVLSPAHHQLHHSNNPRDFNSNFGSNLSVFDTLFGTLNMPAAARPSLTFGIDPSPPQPHALTGWLITPFAESWSALRGHFRPASAMCENVPNPDPT
jgi:sterol desaturase/sphingolipid hydroxylase (fatty acid hydroxylase superfamily)